MRVYSRTDTGAVSWWDWIFAAPESTGSKQASGNHYLSFNGATRQADPNALDKALFLDCTRPTSERVFIAIATSNCYPE